MSGLIPFCPRCGGKMYHIRDLFGEYDNCLNCGYHRDILEGPPISLKSLSAVGAIRHTDQPEHRAVDRLWRPHTYLATTPDTH